MSTIDTDVNKYTISELLAILQLHDLNDEDIMNKTNEYIHRFKNEKNYTLVKFFQNMQTKLLRFSRQENTESYETDETEEIIEGFNNFEYQPDNKQTDNWWKYEALPQDNQVQKDKITDRFQKIDVYDNNHVPMDREQLGVNNVIDTKVAQDILNPNLENITTRFINLDSQFRQASGGVDTISTDYTLDLSDPLTDVLSMRLYSIQIPYTWYTIDYQYGNTCFWVTNLGNSFKINISPGNYTPLEFIAELNLSFQTTGFTGTFSETSPTSYNSMNGKITIALDGFIDPSSNKIVGISENIASDIKIDPYFTFFDFSGEKTCQLNCTAQSLSFNNTLGWLMGFRLPSVDILSSGNTPIAVLDLYGTKYFVLVLDDYNQNHINNGLITITELPNKLTLPSYYNPTLPVSCYNPNIAPRQNILRNITPNQSISLGINPQNIGELIQEKTNISYLKQKTVLPTAPRILTQAQIYTINEIIKNRDRNTSYRGKAPTASDTFALIPLKRSGMKTGEMYVEFSGSLQDNKRIYFGPVDIDRIHLKLIDDRGYTVDLHGSEWCITIIAEILYQY
jgi:hypothetical protein